MSIFRRTLKFVLQKLAAWAIKKHDMQLIVVTGFYGTEIVKEGIYHILNQKYSVRRNTNQILWDMALPLSVLGYKDKKRSGFEWLWLISKATLYLAFGKKNKHILVLNADCTFKETAKFWAGFLKPDYLVIVNINEASPILETLLENMNGGQIIYDKDKAPEIDFGNTNTSKVIAVSKKSGDLIYNEKEYIIKYNRGKVKIPASVPKVVIPFIAGIYGTLVAFGYTLEEVSSESLKFDLGQILINKIKTNFGKERSN